jgi:RNA polymerase sigma-70 factor (ECF subfamily)
VVDSLSTVGQHAWMRDEPSGTLGAPRGVPDDRDLAKRVASGDETAYMTIYDRYGDMLFGTALRFLRDRETAADIVQETMLAVWRRSSQYDANHGSLGAWMLGIARNRAIDRLRAEARRPKVVRPAAPEGAGGEITDLITWASGRVAAGEADEPAAEVDRRWVRALLATTLAEMRPEEREVLVLAYDHGLSQSEIASRLELPIGTVKSRTRRGLAGLRDRLADVPDLRPAASGGWGIGR